MKKWIWLAPLALLLLLVPGIASFQPLKGIFLRAVERKVHANVTIERVRFSWFGPQKYEKIHFSTPELEGTIEQLISRTPFWNLSSHRSFSLSGGTCQVYDPPSSVENVQATVTGSHIDLSGQTQEGGQFLVQGTPANFQASGAHMPSLLLDRLCNAQGYIATALGPEFDFQGNGSAQGSLVLQLSSRQANMNLRAQFQSMRQISGVLDLGRFPLQSNNSLNTVFSLLKRRGVPRAINAWVAPIDFTLEKGILHLERVDFLLDSSIHLCIWGNLDLDRKRLDMTLGLPGDTLSRSLRLPPLPSTFILTVPVRGSFDDPAFSTGSAAAKITALLATQAIPKAGGLLGFFGANIVSESDEAPPAKRPFPWE